MLTKENLVLTRAEPSGLGGLQFLYKIKNYGISAITRPMENITQIHGEVDIIKYADTNSLKYEVCHNTELAKKNLVFHNDKHLNEFLGKAFSYLHELQLLEGMLNK